MADDKQPQTKPENRAAASQTGASDDTGTWLVVVQAPYSEVDLGSLGRFYAGVPVEVSDRDAQHLRDAQERGVASGLLVIELSRLEELDRQRRAEQEAVRKAVEDREAAQAEASRQAQRAKLAGPAGSAGSTTAQKENG